MGLLDPLFNHVLSGFGVQPEDPQGALLSEFLRLPQQPQQVAPQAQATPAPQPASALPEPNFLDRLSAMSRGYGEGGLVGGIADAVNLGDSRGERAQAQQRNHAMDFLVREGHFDDDTANALMSGPEDLRKAVLAGVFKTKKNGGVAEFGKAGTVFQDAKGNFYTVQFASDGTRKILPATAGDVAMSPARGVMQVGDELINKGDGSVVSNVGPNLQAAEDYKQSGQEAAKTRGELPQAKARLDLASGALDSLEQAVTDLGSKPGLPKVAGGLWEAYAPNVSEDARNAGTDLASIKNRIAGTVLQAMREASKTGGAVGAVTEREWPRLEGMIANLDPSQGIDQFRRNLGEVVAYTQRVKAAMRQAYEEDARRVQGGPAGAAAPAAAPRTGQTPSGIRWSLD
jgi:hypothetical protein